MTPCKNAVFPSRTTTLASWKQRLQLLLNTQKQLTCMKEQVLLSHQEHRTFRNHFLLIASSTAFYTLCLLTWVCLQLTRLQQQTSTISNFGLSSYVKKNSLTNEADSKINCKREVKHNKTPNSWSLDVIPRINKQNHFSSMWNITSYVLVRNLTLQTKLTISGRDESPKKRRLSK